MILDTSILIEILRGDFEKDRLEELDEEVLKTTAITEMELWEGVQKAETGDEEEKAVRKMLDELKQASFNSADGRKTAEINSKLEKKGAPTDLEDVMIAAVASNREEELATLNLSDFQQIEEVADLQIESEYS